MPSDPPLIEARGLSKRYRRDRGRIIESMGVHHLLGELAGMPWRTVRRMLRPTEPARSSDDGTFWALENASFDLHAGETLGVIGENGAGKSVLLKILARITPPTEGTATIRGRVGAMLEVSAGFHHELTGRENVFLSGAILGMSQREIAARLNRIIDFAEISDAIDTPVKRYSSGMTARLAFSVAAHLDAEIMLVDEVLAVGDTAFKTKCLDAMRSLARSGRSIVFVSHELDMLERLCDRAILLDHGRILADGEPGALVGMHRNDVDAADTEEIPA